MMMGMNDDAHDDRCMDIHRTVFLQSMMMDGVIHTCGDYICR
jgi:hypothetical protein